MLDERSGQPFRPRIPVGWTADGVGNEVPPIVPFSTTKQPPGSYTVPQP